MRWLKGDAEAAVRRLTACLVDVEAWLKAQLTSKNPTKTQVMWLGFWQQLAKVNVSEVPVASASINVSGTTRNLGVIVDSQLTLTTQVAAICSSVYYQLRQLRPLVRSMPADAVKMLVQAFISCRLDWTTATRCSTASPTVWWASCKSVQNVVHVWCWGLDAMTT